MLRIGQHWLKPSGGLTISMLAATTVVFKGQCMWLHLGCVEDFKSFQTSNMPSKAANKCLSY